MDGPGGQDRERIGAEAEVSDEQRADNGLAEWARAEEQAKGDLPATIYYDLTRYEWYARGEPLGHADASYMPGGRPVRMPASSMRKVGQYRGVEVYVPASDDDAAAIVYVPVFEGFWLPFTRIDLQAQQR
jgi:hypothetical protein